MVLQNQTTTCSLLTILSPASILVTSTVNTKTNWLEMEMVRLICTEYATPDSDIIHQTISQRKLMQDYLLTNGPLLHVPAHENPIATRDNPLTKEDQQIATAHYFSISLIAAAATIVTVKVTQAVNYHQLNLFTFCLVIVRPILSFLFLIPLLYTSVLYFYSPL